MDLNLSKDAAQLLASRLYDKHLLKSDNICPGIDNERKNSVNFTKEESLSILS